MNAAQTRVSPGTTATQGLARQALWWLVLSQLAVMLLLASQVPLWLLPLLLSTALWRFWMLQRRWQLPGAGVRMLAVLLSLVAIAFSGTNPLSLDAATLLLLLGYALKNLEMAHRRDAYLTVFIGYFLVAVSFLFSQTFSATLAGMAVLLLLTAALIGIQLSGSQPILRTLGLSGAMLALSLPLMLAGYLFFPRLPPLWSVPMQQTQGRTGISDSMAPGDFASIAGSGALAFRASFSGEPPPITERYWRGPVLSHYDGRTWTPSIAYVERRALLPDRVLPRTSSVFNPQWQLGEPAGQYVVTYEPSQQWWAFSLTPSRVLRGEASVGKDFQVIAHQRMDQPTRVEYLYYNNALLETDLSPQTAEAALQLPTGSDPRTRQFVAEMVAKHPDPMVFVDNILNWFQTSAFYYSIQPGGLPQTHAVDAFLFDTQRGFCAHYAGALTLMLRMAGIPARVVTGYLGGEWNELGGFVAVHEFDAHAWVEFWLPQRGWVTVDPTAWVAPERIEQNLRSALSDSERFLASSPLYALQFSWFNGLRLRIDAWQYEWQRWIMDYDQRGQALLMARWLGAVNTTKAVLFALGFMAALGILWIAVLGLLRPHASRDPVAAQWSALLKALKEQGVSVQIQTTPLQLSSMLGGLTPQQQTAVQAYLGLLNQYLYLANPPPWASLRQRHRLAIKSLSSGFFSSR